MPGLFSASFAIAGAVAAAAAVLMHLLNRRRTQTIHWAAMDFLREATIRTRRMIRLRDLLLLLLRCAALLAFGLALSRPYLADERVKGDANQPVHAVVVVDNSLSMATEETGGTLLARAREHAAELIEQFPDASRYSIVPLCGPADRFEHEAFRTPQEAREALDRIEPIDGTETASHAIPLIQEALAQASELSAKRILFISDQQQVVWPIASQESIAQAFPELQLIRIDPARIDNAWVADVRLADGYAEAAFETAVEATIRFIGKEPRTNVSVALKVDGVGVATQFVDLSPGQSREVRFLHQFAAAGTMGQVTHVPITIALAHDRLSADDERSLIVPVVTSLPVVFVDQLGRQGENPARNRLGETYYVRQLLAPARRNDSAPHGGLTIRHVTMNELSRQILRDARLVVVAGVAAPGNGAVLLRQYVEQGGQLVIAAGSDFSPGDWSRDAWDNGHGILPAPLQAELKGALPDKRSPDLVPFFLDPGSMTDPVFQVPGAGREELDELYRTPVFFMTAVAHPLPPLSTEERSRANPPFIRKETEPAQDEQRWLQWRPEHAPNPRDAAASPSDGTFPARVLAKFDNGPSFLIERRVGEGTVLLATSGIGSNWNTLPRTSAVLILDRLLRQMIERGLPRRTVETMAAFAVPLPMGEQRSQFECLRPDGSIEAIAIEALGPETFGIVLRNLTQRGIYRVHPIADATVGPAPQGKDAAPSDLVFAVNGPSDESDLTPVDFEQLEQRFATDPAETNLEERAAQSATQSGSRREIWKWLLGAALACLLLEMVCLVLLGPASRRGKLPAGA